MRSTIPLLLLFVAALPSASLACKGGGCPPATKTVSAAVSNDFQFDGAFMANGGVKGDEGAGKKQTADGGDGTGAKTVKQTPNSKNGVGGVTGNIVGTVANVLAKAPGAAPARIPQAPTADDAFNYEAAQQNAATPEAAAVWRRVGALDQGGDKAGALAAAQQALAQNPEDKQLLAFVQMNKMQPQTRVTQKTVSDRAKELMVNLRGDPGEAPPGSALTSSPALASAISFPALGASGAPRALTPAALAEMGRRDSGLRLADPLVRDAVSKFMVRDLPAAEALLNRRLEQNPSDEQALRFRALTRRQMGRYEPSAHDAKGALALAPWDARARRVLIDDMVDLGHSDQALAEANTALRDTPNSAEVLVARARVHESLGDHDAQLVDLKQAASLDAQFDQLYRQTLAGPAAAAPSQRPHSTVVWLGAIGTALLFFSFALFRKRGDSSVRLAMRSEDHAVLARGARPEAAPAGFRIVKTLGQGGMGVVYEAVDLGLQRTVALKKLRAEIADSPRERARFLKEARTVAALKHPNIVEIHSIHEDAEGLFLVFEKVNGETLHERLGRGALAPAEAVAVLRQVAQALDHAHANGVIHQDLKPANVMVSGGTAKVMDFGIARRVAETMSTLSRVEVAGTPAYMAPEQERGGGAGPAADVFALGACAYETLTGRTPFPSGGMMMKAEKMYRPASEVTPGLTQDADAAIARALEPEPGARWPSASSFVEALSRALAVPA